jgi:hypothetical protein
VETLAGITKDSLPDGDHHVLRIKVRDDAGRVVLQVAIHFDVEAEEKPSTDRHSGGGDQHV